VCVGVEKNEGACWSVEHTLYKSVRVAKRAWKSTSIGLPVVMVSNEKHGFQRQPGHDLRKYVICSWFAPMNQIASDHTEIGVSMACVYVSDRLLQARPRIEPIERIGRRDDVGVAEMDQLHEHAPMPKA